jgi:hypothetical protein
MTGEGSRLTGIESADLVTGDHHIMEADHIIFAAGRIPELIYAPVIDENDTPDANGPMRWNAFAPYKQPAHRDETGFMSDGDVLTDFSAAIKAIASGRRAAASIHKSFYDLPLDLEKKVITPATMVQNVDHVTKVARQSRQLMPLADVSNGPDTELEKGLTPEKAQIEANRCLQCGLICYQHTDETDEEAPIASGC